MKLNSFVLMVFIISPVFTSLVDGVNNNEHQLHVREKRFLKLLKSGANATGKLINWARRWKRVVRARNILLTGAKQTKKDADRNVVWYEKLGDEDRAAKDFWMIDAYEVNTGFSDFARSYGQIGTVGDNVVEYLEQYSDLLPFPVITMCRKNSPERTRGKVIAVVYKPFMSN